MWETKKSALGQMHLGEEGCRKSWTHSITWKAHRERVKPAALLWHPSLFFRGLSGKAHSFSPSAQHGNESGTVSHWEGTVQVQARWPSLNRFYWEVKREEHEWTKACPLPGSWKPWLHCSKTCRRQRHQQLLLPGTHCSGAPCSLWALQ